MTPDTSRRDLIRGLTAIFSSFGAVMSHASPRRPRIADRTERLATEQLRYTQPAANWNEALPIGNGRLGAMVFGGVAQERLQLNEDTLWAGSPYTPDNPDALTALPEVRKLIDAGKFVEADALVAAKMMAKPIRQMPYGSMGDFYLTFAGAEQPSVYERSLDVGNAIAAVAFRTKRGKITREYFSSAIDGLVVARFRASDRERLSFDIAYREPREAEYAKSSVTEGIAPTEAGPVNWLAVDYRGNETGKRATVAADGERSLLVQGRNEEAYGIPAGLKFATKLTVLSDGKVSVRDGVLSVADARDVTLLIAGATSFVNYRDVSGDPVAKVREQIATAATRSYAAMRADHIRDYRAFYDRVSLDLGTSSAAAADTDTRLTVAERSDDPALATLYFNYGRYLLISSSRPGTQPANLQGIWNEGVNPPWGSKYTININTEMNYWPAGPSNLGPCSEPLVRMVEDLSVRGAATAKTMYGARGWVTHHNTDLWRAAAPIDHPKAGIWPTGGAWLCNALWDHYEYYPDPTYLKRIYPLLREASRFFLDTLVQDPKGRGLVTSPSLSPENRHILDITVCAGPAMDQQILRDLFRNTVTAGGMLGLDADLLKTISATRAKLAKDRIGAQGQYQEWLDDWDAKVPDLKHRHVSQLYAIYPSDQVNVRDNPDFIAAAKVTLNTRGDLSTGWATAWRICLWARMGDGEHAHRILKEFVSNKRQYPNLLDAHPPFQIDGNFGGAAGILEMLIQSWGGEIRILPALPKAWPNGELKGVRLRGGVSADVAWTNGKLRSLVLSGTPGAKLKVHHAGVTRDVSLDSKGFYKA